MPQIHCPSAHPCPGCDQPISGKARTCPGCRKRICKLCRSFHMGCAGGRCPDCKVALAAAEEIHRGQDSGRHPAGPVLPASHMEILAARAEAGLPLFAGRRASCS